jgi:hypothetical protein
MSHSTFFELDFEKLNNNTELKDTWDIIVNKDTIMSVEFDRPLSAREAYEEFYDNDNYSRIVSQEDIAILDIIDII